jgi:hypothetical protein
MIMELPARTETGLFELGDTVTLEWLNDGRMVYLSLNNCQRTAIETWFKAVEAIGQTWNPELKYMAAYNLTGVGLTPYFRQRSLDMAQVVRHLQGCYAIIISKSDPVSSVTRTYFEHNISRASARVGQVFETDEEALAWLESELDT